MAHTGALANIDLDAIVDRIAAGAFQSHIARELGMAPQNLHRVISKHPGYRDALKLRNMANLDQAQDDITNADDLARAREAFKAAAWRAERECPEEWGNKQQINVGGTIVHVNQLLAEKAGRLIEQDAGDASEYDDAQQHGASGQNTELPTG